MNKLYIYIILLLLTTNIWGADKKVRNDSAAYSWTIGRFGKETDIKLDTSLFRSFYFNPLQENNSFYAFNGSFGSPAKNMIFNERVMDNSFLNITPYKPYLFEFDKAAFYNTKTPYSEFKYGTNTGSKTKGENILSIIHTQNVNKLWNVGVDYKLVNAKGYYTNQQTNDNSFRFFSSYNSPKLNIYLDASLNNFKVQNNGGVVIDSTFRNTDSDSRNYQTRLKDARSEIKNKNLSLVASYKIGREEQIITERDTVYDTSYVYNSFSEIGYALFFKNFAYRFRDAGSDPSYYNYLVHNKSFQDSTYESSAENKVFFKVYGKDSSFLKPEYQLGYFYKFHNHKQSAFSYNPLNDSVERVYSFFDQAVYGSLKNRNNILNYNLTGKYFFYGYDEGNVILDADLKKPIGKTDTSRWSEAYINYNYKTQKPNVFLNSYIANSSFWINDFDDSERHFFKLGLRSSKYNFDVSFTYSMNKNLIYFNNNALPEQKDGYMYSNTIDVRKDFYFWKLVSSSRYVNQMATSNAVDVPQHTVRSSLFFNDNIYFKRTGGVLGIQLGVTATWFSEYYVYSYAPFINQFHTQDITKYGGYSYIDVFLNARIKSFRLFLEMSHLNQSNKNKEYFTVYPYAMNPRVFRFGVAWLFYN